MEWEYLVLNLKCYLDQDYDLMVSEFDIPESVKDIIEFDEDEDEEQRVEFILDAYGKLNWELLSIIRLDDDVISYTFKQPLDEDEDEYESHCWNCGEEVSSEYCDKCSECGWFECSNCNSCDCNRNT